MTDQIEHIAEQLAETALAAREKRSAAAPVVGALAGAAAGGLHGYIRAPDEKKVRRRVLRDALIGGAGGAAAGYGFSRLNLPGPDGGDGSQNIVADALAEQTGRSRAALPIGDLTADEVYSVTNPSFLNRHKWIVGAGGVGAGGSLAKTWADSRLAWINLLRNGAEISKYPELLQELGIGADQAESFAEALRNVDSMAAPPNPWTSPQRFQEWKDNPITARNPHPPVGLRKLYERAVDRLSGGNVDRKHAIRGVLGSIPLPGKHERRVRTALGMVGNQAETSASQLLNDLQRAGILDVSDESLTSRLMKVYKKAVKGLSAASTPAAADAVREKLRNLEGAMRTVDSLRDLQAKYPGILTDQRINDALRQPGRRDVLLSALQQESKDRAKRVVQSAYLHGAGMPVVKGDVKKVVSPFGWGRGAGSRAVRAAGISMAVPLLFKWLRTR